MAVVKNWSNSSFLHGRSAFIMLPRTAAPFWRTLVVEGSGRKKSFGLGMRFVASTVAGSSSSLDWVRSKRPSFPSLANGGIFLGQVRCSECGSLFDSLGGWRLLMEILLHLGQSLIDFFELGIFLAFVAALLNCSYHIA